MELKDSAWSRGSSYRELRNPLHGVESIRRFRGTLGFTVVTRIHYMELKDVVVVPAAVRRFNPFPGIHYMELKENFHCKIRRRLEEVRNPLHGVESTLCMSLRTRSWLGIHYMELKGQHWYSMIMAVKEWGIHYMELKVTEPSLPTDTLILLLNPLHGVERITKEQCTVTLSPSTESITWSWKDQESKGREGSP